MTLVDNELSEPYSIFTYRCKWLSTSPVAYRAALPRTLLHLQLVLQAAHWITDQYSHCYCRYFLHSWPKLCFMASDGAHCFGTVVCKMDVHGDLLRGYIAMLVVEHAYRGLGVGAPSLSCCCQAPSRVIDPV